MRGKAMPNAPWLLRGIWKEELADLPQAIARYGEIAAQFPSTQAARAAQSRRAMLEQAQTRLADRDSISQDSTQVFYEAVVEIAPDYFCRAEKTRHELQQPTVLEHALGSENGNGIDKRSQLVDLGETGQHVVAL